MFIKLFCNHNYINDTTIHSERVKNDNHVYSVTHSKCVKCSKYKHTKKLIEVEKDWYIKNS